MTLLSDLTWRAHYTSAKHDLLREFYLPALDCAARYDRKTGYFSARALHLAARGIEGLVRNGGHMRLLVGCTLETPEIEAIERGTSVRDAVAQRTGALDPRSLEERGALELLAWMVAQGVLEVKVAVPCGKERKPVPSDAIFHVKAGVIQDKTGDRLGFSGSINETASGWQGNIESFHVYGDWKGTESKSHLDAEDEDFSTLWADKYPHAVVVDVPTAVRDDLLRFLPAEERRPRRLDPAPPVDPPVAQPGEVREGPTEFVPTRPTPAEDLRRLVWGIIKHGPALPGGGDRVGEATCAVTPWPHQIRAFERMYGAWPPRILIADEVGLGKTIEAGLLLRQAWLAGRAKRILILAPRAVLGQWQIELREKFNLNWPIYDGRALIWYPSKALGRDTEREVGRDAWHREPCVIASSQLVRRADRAGELLEQTEPYDLVVLDEAHHARRHSPGATKDKGPNRLLALMQRLRDRTKGLLLLTATPMQVHPIEVYDLLALLGLPEAWTPSAFLEYFEKASSDNPSHEVLDRLCALLRPLEATYGAAQEAAITRLDPELGKFAARKILKALRSDASTPRRHLEVRERTAAIRFLRRQTPVGRLVSRHTRTVLRRYQQEGHLDLRIAEREVEDCLVALSPRERGIYDRVEDYISTTYDNAAPGKRNAVGFVMTVYRKRLASSFAALARTLEDRHTVAGIRPERADEDVSDDEMGDEPMDAEEAASLAHEALVDEERTEIDALLREVRGLPPDTKATRLCGELNALKGRGYEQAIVFTQFTDTVDFLRGHLVREGRRVICFSGRGGERPGTDGRWTKISREDAKRIFKCGDADLLQCTDAAAEGLNFQFCGALVNYDMPWNPMRVEQRIGRIDRLGQKFDRIQIVNLLYEDTIETDVYLALRQRIGLFEQFVGRLQPILSRLSGRISHAALSGRGKREQVRSMLVQEIKDEAAQPAAGGLDIDEATDADLDTGPRHPPLYDLDDLERLLQRSELLPPGMKIRPLHEREYAVTTPGLTREVRVTTDATFYEGQPESTKLWSPGSSLFAPPGSVSTQEEVARAAVRLRDLLASETEPSQPPVSRSP